MSEYVFPVGTLVKVEMEVAIPVAATEAQIMEWLEFEHHANGQMACGNPLEHSEAEPFGWSYKCDITDRIGREVRSDERINPDSSVTYKVRYVREPLPVPNATAPSQDTPAADTAQAPAGASDVRSEE